MSMENAVNTLRRFCVDNGKDADFEKLNRHQLNELLCLFYAEVQKCKTNKNNQNLSYSKLTINAIRYGLYKYISSINSRIDIIHDPEFDAAEIAFKARLDHIDKKTTSISQVVSMKDVKRLYLLTSTFDTSEPVGLQSKVLFEVLLYLCKGDNTVLQEMRQDSFKIKTDHSGKRYVVFGKDRSTPEANRMYENSGNLLCPLASFQKYMTRLNPLCASFWQQPRKLSDDDQMVWYDSSPLSSSILDKMMMEISKSGQLSKIYKNEDVIATSPSVMSKEIFKPAKKKDEEKTDATSEGEDSDEEKSNSSVTSNVGGGTNMPGFYPGTTWPIDATLELLINYEAVKEVRTVKKQFYPLLYHLTRTDYDSIVKSISKIKPLMELMKTRFSPSKSGTTESLKSETVLDGKPTRTANKIRQDTAILTDIQDAKKEMLKLFSRMDLKRQDFAKMLCWLQKLELKIGRFGDQYISESGEEKSGGSKPKIYNTRKKQRVVLPDPPKVSSRLRSGEKPPTKSTKIETRLQKTKGQTKSINRKGDRSMSPKPSHCRGDNRSVSPKSTHHKETQKQKESVSSLKIKIGNKRKEMDETSDKGKKLDIRKPRGRPKRLASSTKSDSDVEVPNSESSNSLNVNDNEFVPNKRFRMAEQEEQTEMEDLYIDDNQPVPLCLYKVEADEDSADDDDDDMQIVESETWFPPPQVEIENLEGSSSIKKEKVIKEEMSEKQSETPSLVRNSSAIFESFSSENSVNTISSSVNIPASVQMEFESSGSNIQIPITVSQILETTSSSTNFAEGPSSILPSTLNSNDDGTFSDSNQETLHPEPSHSGHRTEPAKRSIRTCLGDECLGDDCPHEHIVVSKVRSNLENDQNAIVITQNIDQENECDDISDYNNSEPTFSDIISSVVEGSFLRSSYQSPESTVPAPENQVTSVDSTNQPKSVMVKNEVTTFVEFDDGKEADPIIIIDDD